MTAPRRAFPPPPTEARILILRAHPSSESFNSALATHYGKGAQEAGASVRTIDVDALDFDLRLHGPPFGSQPLEADLRDLQSTLSSSAHLVVASPVWWGSIPASFKAMIDRVFLPGWAYRTTDSGMPEKGLAGRSARVLLTMDAPGWWDRWAYGRSASRQLVNAWLRFVGYQTYRTERFTKIDKTDAPTRERMLRRAQGLGMRDGKKIVSKLPLAAPQIGSSIGTSA